MRQAGLFGLSDHLKRLSAHGDPLEVLARVVDFEAFRPTLVEALGYSDGTKGGRPPYDPVTMLKVLVLAAQNNVSDARMEYLIRDRLSWLRFLGFDLGAPTPDANTKRWTRAPAAGRRNASALPASRTSPPGLSRTTTTRMLSAGSSASPAPITVFQPTKGGSRAIRSSERKPDRS